MKAQISRVASLLEQPNPNPGKALMMLKPLTNRRNTPWPVFHYLGVAYIQQKKFGPALRWLQKSLSVGSDKAITYHLVSICHYSLGAFGAAEKFEKQALEVKGFYKGWMHLAAVYRAQAKLKDALECYKQANGIEPDNSEVTEKMAEIYRDQGRLDKAIELLEFTINADKDNAAAYVTIAQILIQKKQYEKAEEYLNTVIQKKPEITFARMILVELYRQKGDYKQSIECSKRLLEENPASKVRLNYGLCLQELGRFDEAEEQYMRALNDHPDLYQALSNYLMCLHYNPKQSKGDIFEAHSLWDQHFASKERPARPEPANKDRQKKLRIGLLSGGLKMHPVGWMITKGLENLPSDQFEIYCYTTNNRYDFITNRISAIADKWQSVVGYNDEVTAEIIREDEIDILIELSGHAAHNRLRTIALEPAPVIAKWVGGLFNTTGLQSVDYLITDRYESPIGEEPFYTEKLVRMPDDYICYLPPAYAPDVEALPAKEKGYITFGCFNNPSKINDLILEQWSKILARLPESRLMLKSKQYDTEALRDQVISRMKDCGISDERLIFKGHSNHDEHLSDYNQVDIALDPWPYSGGVTTCEALWMGVPVITKPGPTFAGRHTTTHLSNAGFPDWIADTWDQYIETVVSMAENIEQLKKLRSTLRDNVEASPLCDGKRFGAHLAVALREMWKQRVDGYEGEVKNWQDHITVEALSDDKIREHAAVTKAEKVKLETGNDGTTEVGETTVTNGWAEKEHAAELGNSKIPASDSQVKNGPGESHCQTAQEDKEPGVFKIETKEGITVCTPDDLNMLTPYVLLEQEEWFEPELDFVRSFLKPGMNIVDAGAGFGVYALPMAKITGAEGKVYAFEPGSISRRYLEMSKVENHFENLEITGRAVSDRAGDAHWRTAETPELNRIDEVGTEEISQTTLDAWWMFENRPSIDFFKVDVNGDELKALVGAEKLLSENDPVLLIAVGEGNQKNIEYLEDFLKEKNYRLYEFIPGPGLLAEYDIDVETNPYLMNVIAINECSRQKFIAEGWIYDTGNKPDEPEEGLWKEALGELPWAESQLSTWIKQAEKGEHKEYLRALDYLCAAKRIDSSESKNSLSRSEKGTLLIEAVQIMIELYNNGSKQTPLALTLARGLHAIGKRAQAVEVLNAVMNQKEHLQAHQPFLLPLPGQDALPIKTDFAKWLTVRLVEAWLQLKNISSCFIDEEELEVLKILEENPEKSHAIERINLLINEDSRTNLDTGRNRWFWNNEELSDEVVQPVNLNGKKIRNGTTRSLNHLYLAVPGTQGGAHGIHEIMATKLARAVEQQGVQASIVSASSPDFIKKIVYASENPGHVFYAGVMGYDIGIQTDMNVSGSLFDLLDVPVMGFLGDHPYTNFMWNRMERSAGKTIFVTPFESLKKEYDHIFSKGTEAELIKYWPPATQLNRKLQEKSLKDRSVDILIPLGLHKFLAEKSSFNEQLQKLGRRAENIGEKLYRAGLKDYDKSLYDVFLSITECEFGRTYRFSTQKSDEDKRWLHVLSLVDWRIRKDRRLQMLETVAKISDEYDITITAHPKAASFIPSLQGKANINWVGEVSGPQLDKLYGEAKIVLNCNPTYPDTIHGRVRNAMANGCCVISDYNPVLEEVFEQDNAIGLLKADQYLGDYLSRGWDELQTIADKGREIMRSRFTGEAMAKRIIEIAAKAVTHSGKKNNYKGQTAKNRG